MRCRNASWKHYDMSNAETRVHGKMREGNPAWFPLKEGWERETKAPASHSTALRHGSKKASSRFGDGKAQAEAMIGFSATGEMPAAGKLRPDENTGESYRIAALSNGLPGLSNDSPGLSNDSTGLSNDSTGLSKGSPGFSKGFPGLINVIPTVFSVIPGLGFRIPPPIREIPGLFDGTSEPSIRDKARSC